MKHWKPLQLFLQFSLTPILLKAKNQKKKKIKKKGKPNFFLNLYKGNYCEKKIADIQKTET